MASAKSGGASAPPPQITFTEDDVKKIVAFINYVHTNMGWPEGVSAKEIAEYQRIYKGAVEHVKVCENHIMELKAVIDKGTD